MALTRKPGLLRGSPRAGSGGPGGRPIRREPRAPGVCRPRQSARRARAPDAGPGARRRRADPGSRAALQTTLDRSPDSPLAHWWLAWIQEGLNEVSAARRHLELAAPKVLAGRDRLWGSIGRLARIEGDFGGAVTAFTRAVGRNLNSAEAHKNLGLAYLDEHRIHEAFRELVAVCLVEPGVVEAHAAIGRIYLDQGRYDDAAAALRPGGRAVAGLLRGALRAGRCPDAAGRCRRRRPGIRRLRAGVARGAGCPAPRHGARRPHRRGDASRRRGPARSSRRSVAAGRRARAPESRPPSEPGFGADRCRPALRGDWALRNGSRT